MTPEEYEIHINKILNWVDFIKIILVKLLKWILELVLGIAFCTKQTIHSTYWYLYTLFQEWSSKGITFKSNNKTKSK
jgi:hypothetical protein